MLVNEILSRGLGDRRAVARYAMPDLPPDESGQRRREKGIARAGNARVSYGTILLAWRFLLYQKDSALAVLGAAPDAVAGTRKAMIVALARKLLIAFWRLVTTDEDPEGSSPASGIKFGGTFDRTSIEVLAAAIASADNNPRWW